MKMTVQWYEDNLRNRKISIEREKVNLQRLKDDIARSEAYYAFLELQIKTAKEQGKDAFDCERFLVKKSKKTLE